MSPLPQFAAGQRPHRVTFQTPGDPVPDGSGGYVEGWTDLDPPQMFVRIQPASVADMERITSGTVIGSASHLVTGPYHPGVTTQSRIVWRDIAGKSRTFTVAGVVNPEERCIDTVLLCKERL